MKEKITLSKTGWSTFWMLLVTGLSLLLMEGFIALTSTLMMQTAFHYDLKNVLLSTLIPMLATLITVVLIKTIIRDSDYGVQILVVYAVLFVLSAITVGILVSFLSTSYNTMRYFELTYVFLIIPGLIFLVSSGLYVLFVLVVHSHHAALYSLLISAGIACIALTILILVKIYANQQRPNDPELISCYICLGLSVLTFGIGCLQSKVVGDLISAFAVAFETAILIAVVVGAIIAIIIIVCMGAIAASIGNSSTVTVKPGDTIRIEN